MRNEYVDFNDRYWFIGYATYYPVGGLTDVRCTANSIEGIYDEVKSDNISTDPSDTNYIFDAKEREKVEFDLGRVYE